MTLRSKKSVLRYLNELKQITKEYDMNEIEPDEALILEIQIETLEWVLKRNTGRIWL